MSARTRPSALVALSLVASIGLLGAPALGQEGGAETPSGGTSRDAVDTGSDASEPGLATEGGVTDDPVDAAPVPAPTDERTAPRASGTALASDVYRPLGPNLFPFYTHELRTSDETEIRQVLGLYRTTRRPDGDRSLLLLPFVYSESDYADRTAAERGETQDRRLYLFPLYYSRHSAEDSFFHLVPFYFDQRSPSGRFRFLVPFWLGTENSDGSQRSDHVLFPLFRRRVDEQEGQVPVTAKRLGLWRLLELWERRTTPQTRDTTLLNLLNWGEEAQNGLALYRSHWVDRGSTEGGELWQGREVLFPLYWHGVGASSSYRYVIPFFGWAADGSRYDLTLFPILSRFGRGPGDDRRVDVLFPFFHYARGRDEFSVASYPFFDYAEYGDKQHLGILFWLYRRYIDKTQGRKASMVLFPLSYSASTNDGAEGRKWILPYYSSWSLEHRTRLLLPLFYKGEDLVDGEPTGHATWIFPLYFGWGTPESWRGVGFPLVWLGHEVDRGWRLALPFYYRFYRRVSDDLFLVPFYGYRKQPFRTQHFFGGPLYVHERHYGADENLTGTTHHVLWPLVKIENHDTGFDYRLLPLFWLTRLENRTGLMATPFYFQQTGPEGTYRYLFPFYARFDSPRETREFRGAGAWSRHRILREDGSHAFDSTSWAWWLATFERDDTTDTTHSRILPLLWWQTKAPTVERTISAPFYYSHRIREHDEVHELDLFLGNLWFSKTVERQPSIPIEPPVAPVIANGAEDETATDDGDTLDVAESASSELTEVDVERRDGQIVWRDRGVLWPLTRSYESSDGEKGRWLLPFFADVRSDAHETFALFPFWFGRHDRFDYTPSYFRYFFLFDRETFNDGYRVSVGQLLFDILRRSSDDSTRVRLFYPLFEFAKSESHFEYAITPLITGSSRIGGGERESRHTVFPIFWTGSEERLDAEGNWESESAHFFLFPLFGKERRASRTDYRVLYPIFHWQTSPESVEAEAWPFVFYRERPALSARRLWPLHSHETGESAGEFWVSNWLFLSKYHAKEGEMSYRLDPFLFRYERTADAFRIGGLLEAVAYSRSADDTSLRAIPFVFAHRSRDHSSTAIIPLYYDEDFVDAPIDYWSVARFFFLTNSASGAGGERHFSLLTKVAEYTWSTERKDCSEFRFLHRVIFHYDTETSKQVEWNPFFQYYRDDVEGTSTFSILGYLYRKETTRQGTVHRILGLGF